MKILLHAYSLPSLSVIRILASNEILSLDISTNKFSGSMDSIIPSSMMTTLVHNRRGPFGTKFSKLGSGIPLKSME